MRGRGLEFAVVEAFDLDGFDGRNAPAAKFLQIGLVAVPPKQPGRVRDGKLLSLDSIEEAQSLLVLEVVPPDDQRKDKVVA